MWQVVTSPSAMELFAGAENKLSDAELDALLNALSAFQPPLSLPAPPPQNLLPFRPKTGGLHPPPPTNVRVQDALSTMEMPRSVHALEPVTLPPEVRQPLLDLRTKVMLAAEVEGLRTVLLCGADGPDSSCPLAAHLSQLLAEYERLKVAYLVVSGDAPTTTRRNVLPVGYTFQLRRTRPPNLYEIASSLGLVRLEDWLRWWSPAVVMQEMKKVFDLVVIQAPAIMTHPDVALLAAVVDGVILVATEHETSYLSIAAATQRLRAAKARILGVMLHPMRNPPATTSPFSGVKARVRELMEALVKGK